MPDSPKLHPASAIPFNDIRKAAEDQVQHGKEPVAESPAERGQHPAWCRP
jgi:hypothetical protein